MHIDIFLIIVCIPNQPNRTFRYDDDEICMYNMYTINQIVPAIYNNYIIY